MNIRIPVVLIIVSLFITSCASMKASGSNQREIIVRAAKDMQGKRYAYGKQDRQNGFDCSGLTQYAYKKAGVNIPRTSNSQYKRSRKIDRNELEKGDLVFFSTKGSGASHVGIYIGNNQIIHSPSAGKKVQIVSLNNPYWKKAYFAAGRYIK